MNQHEELDEKFEEELTQAMRAVDAPEGFADRVMGRAQASALGSSDAAVSRAGAPAPQRAKIFTMPASRRAWISGALAASLVLGGYMGDQVHLRHQRERAEVARQKAELAQQQFELAMRITGDTLARVQRQLQRADVPAGN